MSRGFLKRSVLQLVVSAGQIVILGLFIVLFPRMATSATDWAAGYFLTMAITTPIFMFFTFELRKRTAAHEGEDILHLNRQRMMGTLSATLVSLIAFVALWLAGFFSDIYLFLVIVFFKIAQNINDQITANYEWQDAFRNSAMSGGLRVLAFVPIAAGVSMFMGPNLGIILGTLAFVAVWVVFDARHAIKVPRWFGATKIGADTWLAGLGAFIISLTVNAPRVLVAMLFGEAALIIMGVGQSLNRIGQIISGSLVQTLLAVRKKAGTDNAKNQSIVAMAQVAVLIGMLALIPLWKIVFDYASEAPGFTIAMIALLIFGFASQINYMIQSLLLVAKGSAQFAASPVYFLIVLAMGTVLLWLTGLLGFFTFLILMIVARIIQSLLNLWQLRLEA